MKLAIVAIAVLLLLGWAEMQYVREVSDQSPEFFAARRFAEASPEVAAKVGTLQTMTFIHGTLTDKRLSRGEEERFAVTLHGDRGEDRLDIGVVTWNAHQTVSEAKLDGQWLPVAGQ